MELRGELTDRNGLKRPLRVSCEPPGELRGLRSGLAVLKEQVAALLGPLVQQESGDAGERAGAGDNEEDIDEEEDEEENHINAKACPDGPPIKRTKTHS